MKNETGTRPRNGQSMLTGMVIAAVLSLSISPTFAMGDVETGAKIFKKCASCHKLGDDAKNGIGPVLNNLIGRQAGTFEDFKYSKSMIAAGEAGLVWDEELLFDYIADPRSFLREFLDDKKARAKMPFKLKKEEDRRNVLAYIATFSDADQAQ